MTYRVAIHTPGAPLQVLRHPYPTFNAAVAAAGQMWPETPGEAIGVTHTGENAGFQRVV